MANVTVIGAQWGDEGKGKIVDWLSERADVVVRFQGGHNAGHTLVIAGQTYKLSLLPSGVVRPGKLGVIGNGVVLDPYALASEVEKLRSQGVPISRDNLRVADDAHTVEKVEEVAFRGVEGQIAHVELRGGDFHGLGLALRARSRHGGICARRPVVS